jgi:hypothetical protein
MPFILFPVWFLLIVLGLVALVSRSRYLSTYLIFSSTFGFIGSTILSLGNLRILFVFGFHDRQSVVGAVVITVAYVGGILVGAVIGVVAGIRLARQLNDRLGWREA